MPDLFTAHDGTGLRIAYGSWSYCARVAKLRLATKPVLIRRMPDEDADIYQNGDEPEDPCSEAAIERRNDDAARALDMGAPWWAH